jgi:hypothetical protein
MPTDYYRMSSGHALEAARQRLISQPYQSPSRVLGHASRLILRVAYRSGSPPDHLIHQLDHMAQRLPHPPTVRPTTTVGCDQAAATGPGCLSH